MNRFDGRFRYIIAGALLMLLVAGGLAAAGPTPGAAAQDAIPIATGREPRAVYNSAGNEYLITYQAGPVYAVRLFSDGTLHSTALRLSDDIWERKESPAAAYNATVNGYLAVWEDWRTGMGPEVVGQRLAGNGALVGGNFRISADPMWGMAPDVAYNGRDNEYLVVWVVNYEVRARIVGADGSFETDPFTIGALTVTGDADAAPVWNSVDNEYLVIWGDGDAVIGQRLSPAGAALGGPLTIAAGLYGSYDVAYNAEDNEYLVVWDESSAHDVMGQRLAAGGAALGSPFVVQQQEYQGAHSAFGPVVSYNPAADRYLVAFRDDWKPIHEALGVQHVGADGDPLDHFYLIGGPPWCGESPGWVSAQDVVANARDNRWLTLDLGGCPALEPEIRGYLVPGPWPTPTPTATATSTPPRVYLPLVRK